MSPTASTREILKGNAVGGPIPSRDGKKEKNNMPAVMDKIIDCWVFILLLSCPYYLSLVSLSSPILICIVIDWG